MFLHLNVGEKVYHIAQSSFIQLGAGKVFGQNAFQAWILFFNQAHGIVYGCTYFGGMCGFCHYSPACFLWYKENILRSVFIFVFFKAVAFFYKFIVFCFEAVRNVFQENKPQNYGFILRSIKITS